MRVPELARRANEDGSTVLIAACCGAHRSVVQLLCDLGADVNTRSALGETPLINVVRGAAAEVAKEPVAAARLLLEGGADPNVLAYDGCNRLHQAIIHSNVDLVRLFLASAQIHEFGSSIRRVTKTHSSWQRPAGPGDPTSVSVKFSMCWRDFQKRRSTSDEAEPATGPLRGWCVAQLREGVCYAAGDACQTAARGLKTPQSRTYVVPTPRVTSRIWSAGHSQEDSLTH